MARVRVTFQRLARDFAVGAVVSVLVGWGVPDLGRARDDSGPSTSSTSGPFHLRSTTLTSTVYRRSFLFHKGAPEHPVLPSDPEALAREMRGLAYRVGLEHYGCVNPHLIDPRTSATWTADFRGFPFRCLWSWRAEPDFLNPDNRPLSSSLDLPGFVTVPGEVGYRLPLTPVWMGLLADAAFWGAVFFFVRRIPAWVRARIEASRIARGLCPRCLYPLVEDADRCPECGRGMAATTAAS